MLGNALRSHNVSSLIHLSGISALIFVVALIVASCGGGGTTDNAIERVGANGDPRVAWLLTDIVRFTQPGTAISDAIFHAWEDMTGRSVSGPDSRWGLTTNHLLAWDTPAPPGYIEWKRQVFELIEPGLTDAAGGDWYPDERIVFGVVPCCTLCGSARAYFTDNVSPAAGFGDANTYELRTSGLLSRSNKVMYEFHTKSVASAGPTRRIHSAAATTTA